MESSWETGGESTAVGTSPLPDFENSTPLRRY
jgi:hypothetical protein